MKVTNDIIAQGKSPLKFDLDTAYQFLQEVHGDTEGKYFTICGIVHRSNDIVRGFFETVEEAVTYIKNFEGTEYNVYFSMGRFDEPLQGNQRGKAEHVTAIPGVWADIDFMSEAKEGSHNLPRHWEDAQKILSMFPEPTIITHSGHGIQPIWLFNEPLADMEQAQQLLRAWVNSISFRSVEAGFSKLDSVLDIARVMRVPGTINKKRSKDGKKYPPVPAKIIAHSGKRYEPEDLEPYIVQGADELTRKQTAAAVALNHPSSEELVLDPEAVPPQEKFNLLRQSSRFRQLWEMQDPDKGNDFSRYDLGLANIAVAKKWTDQEIADLLIAFRRKHAPGDEKVVTRTDYINRTIAKARAGVIPFPKAKKQDDSKPTVMLDGHIGDQVQDVLKVLNELPLNLYNRSGMLSRVVIDKDTQEPKTVQATADTLHALATKHINFYKTKSVQGMPTVTVANPTERIFKNVLSLEEDWKFPYLKTVSTAPAFRKDGSFVSANGYDEELKMYFHLGEEGLVNCYVPEHPTPEDAKKAVQFLREKVFIDVAFDADRDFANALAFAITPMIQPLLHRDETPPGFAIDAPKKGTGKGYLYKIIGNIVFGKQIGSLPFPDREEELGKRLDAIALQSLPVVVFDNIRRKVQSESLEAFITDNVWNLRLLGESKMYTVNKNTIVVVVGNNLQTNEDMASRLCWIRLDTKLSKPEGRDIRNEDILKFTQTHRGECLAALLTMVKAWFEQGCPEDADVGRGRFRQWRKVVGNILAVAGVQGFMQHGDIGNSYEEEQWGTFLEAWKDQIPEPKTATQLVNHFNRELADVLPDDISLILDDPNAKTRGITTKLGKRLAEKEGTPYGEHNLKIRSKRNKHGVFYSVVED